ncbi:MBL fold metallo-hydrolase [Georgenia faecalis]|uniref:MBL fold metallo-hydrolase n=1 Tax=Georgenia faecalis TaxID=2483799 RepID=A0ABV9DCU9_9MICO|nr:MBL fold metallo-hydrolase [Georgenia faecalis]
MNPGPDGAARDLVAVAPGVWVATADRWTTTSTVVLGDDGGCLVVDPALTEPELAGLAAEIDRRGWRAVAGVSTHPHWDHLLGPVAFPGVPHWATPAAAAWAASHAADIRAEAAAELTGPVPAGLSAVTALDPARPLPWPGPRAELLALPGHAPGHAGLLLAGARTLLCGDLLSDVEVPLLDLDDAACLTSYRATLAAIEALVRAGTVTVVVPGHGGVADGGATLARIAADRRYLDDLEAGRPSADPRLADPWVRAEHDRQAAHLVPGSP